jgi:predicted dehydrogenase
MSRSSAASERLRASTLWLRRTNSATIAVPTVPVPPKTSESCYLIGGSRGGLSLPDLRVWRHDAEPDWWTPISARNLTCTMDDPLTVQMAHFARVIVGEEPPLVSGDEGLKSLEVVEAVALSSSTGQEITIASSNPTMDHLPKSA